MTSDRRYEKECKEVSDRAEVYSVCNIVFVQRAQALGNLTSKRKTEEVNAAIAHQDGGKGKGRKGRGHDTHDEKRVVPKEADFTTA